VEEAVIDCKCITKQTLVNLSLSLKARNGIHVKICILTTVVAVSKKETH